MRSLRIVTTGLAATFPLGGIFWHYLQYALGFQRLGHEVLYLEDTGRWCYAPHRRTFVEDGRGSAFHLERALRDLDPVLARRWFFRDAGGHCYGCDWNEVRRFCAEADLFLNISGACILRDEYLRARRLALVDTDPMYTQALLPAHTAGNLDGEDLRRMESLRQHHTFFTYALNIGDATCRVPSGGLRWLPTRQPVVFEQWPLAPPARERRRILATVASWSAGGTSTGGLDLGGKSVEFERFLELPSRSAVPLELALSGEAPAERLRQAGWRLVDGSAVSSDPWLYRSYLAGTLGEWSVAKHAYVASWSGWFSDRTASYLAMGLPAVVQETGFSRVLPTGKGLFAFSDPEEALAAIDQIARDPDYHSAAARILAEEEFESGRVLTQLIRDAVESDA